MLQQPRVDSGAHRISNRSTLRARPLNPNQEEVKQPEAASTNPAANEPASDIVAQTTFAVPVPPTRRR